MFKRVLVANRGEIAVRIIRTLREMNIESVAVYSNEDAQSMHVKMATTAVCIGVARVSESYLKEDNIIMAAINTHCDAVHPGFGFLSESSSFAKSCKEHNLVFIGPEPECMDLMGNKNEARTLMKSCGVPIVEGSDGLITNVEQAKQVANRIGYPVLLKASSGGGGKGIRRVDDNDGLEKAFHDAAKEAEAFFGDGSIYLEKFIENPRHIEVQILRDNFGNTLALGERNCSLQRKNQKLMEEAPSPNISLNLKNALKAAAIKAANAADYKNAGTIEFLVDKNENFYFIEMNTRIQVEHGITELITGIDIVKEQVRIAQNLKLKVKQENIVENGWAIEARINAEDATNNFSSSVGTIEFLNFPAGNGVRVDSFIYQGYTLSPYYDSMVAKILVHAATRNEAIRKMRRALEETIIEGIKTTININYMLLFEDEFVKGNYTTNFIEHNLPRIVKALNIPKSEVGNE